MSTETSLTVSVRGEGFSTRMAPASKGGPEPLNITPGSPSHGLGRDPSPRLSAYPTYTLAAWGSAAPSAESAGTRIKADSAPISTRVIENRFTALPSFSPPRGGREVLMPGTPKPDVKPLLMYSTERRSSNIRQTGDFAIFGRKWVVAQPSGRPHPGGWVRRWSSSGQAIVPGPGACSGCAERT